MLRYVIGFSVVLLLTSGAAAQSATETLGFLLGGFDMIAEGQTSATERYDLGCGHADCYVEDTYRKIDDCHYQHVSTVHNQTTDTHTFNLDMSQAAMLGSHTDLSKHTVPAIIGSDKLDCGDLDVGDGTFCTNYELLKSYPKPPDAARATAAFAYFQEKFCKGRAF